MVSNPESKTHCTLCQQDTSNRAEVSGSKVIDNKYIQYNLCTSCYAKRPKIKFIRGHKNTTESDAFWDNVTSQALLLANPG